MCERVDDCVCVHSCMTVLYCTVLYGRVMATRTQGAALQSMKAVQTYARTGGKVMRPLCSVLDPSQWNTPS